MSNFSINVRDSLKILGVSGSFDPSIIKAAYRKCCAKYHPDRNPAGLEMMKSVNLAYECVRDMTDNISLDESVLNYGDDLNDAINAIINLGLDIDVCGSWVWVTGNTKEHKTILKSSGYKWARKKVAWYFRPADFKSFSRGKFSLDQIKEKYGASSVAPKSHTLITH
jgi:DnaJ domain